MDPLNFWAYLFTWGHGDTLSKDVAKAKYSASNIVLYSPDDHSFVKNFLSTYYV